MKQWLSYYFCTCLIFISACTSTKELSTTAEFKENYRSSEIYKSSFKNGLIQFLDYRTYKNTSIGSSRKDSTLTPGIIQKKTSIIEINTEREIQFGNRSGKCIIHYTYFLKYHHTGRSATLSILNLLSKEPDKTEQEEDDHTLSVRATGTIQYPAFKDVISFSFDGDETNTMNTTGQLLIGSDSFVLKPITALKTLVSLQLVKGATIYAYLRPPDNISSSDRIFLYNKATAAEQMIIAAYFTVVVRYW